MTSLSILTIEGILQPHVPQRCGLEMSETSSPEMYQHTMDFDLYKSIIIRDDFENYFEFRDPNFWKLRITIHMVTAPRILSISFSPRTLANCHILFQQKVHLYQHKIGFMVPSLSLEDQARLEDATPVPSCWSLYEEKQIDSTLGGWDLFADELRPILRFFLKDNTSNFLGVTCISLQGQFVTRCWQKA